MKVIHTIVILIVLILLTGCTTHQKPSQQSFSNYELCKSVNETEIIALFDRWNEALQTGDPAKVVANYANNSVLLPTLSNSPKLTPLEKEEYFAHFLQKSPVGKIDFRQIKIGCNMAIDSGLYTFSLQKTGEMISGRYTFVYEWNGSDWLIVNHHSSVMPENK